MLHSKRHFEQAHTGQMPDHITLAIIGFHSYHIIRALFLWFLFESTKLFIPLAIVNTIICPTTLLLGWHYLMDVLASFFLVTFAMFITHKQTYLVFLSTI